VHRLTVKSKLLVSSVLFTVKESFKYNALQFEKGWRYNQNSWRKSPSTNNWMENGWFYIRLSSFSPSWKWSFSVKNSKRPIMYLVIVSQSVNIFSNFSLFCFFELRWIEHFKFLCFVLIVRGLEYHRTKKKSKYCRNNE